MKNAKLLTQQKSASPNQCYYFTSLPCELDNGNVFQSAKSLTTAIKPNRPSYLRASVRLINDSKKGRRSLKTQCLNQLNYLIYVIFFATMWWWIKLYIKTVLVIPFVRSDFASYAFSVSSPTLWNNLPQDVRSCANQATFKSRLKSHLFSLAFTV